MRYSIYILPIRESDVAYANHICTQLNELGFVDARKEKLGFRIREAIKNDSIEYIFTIGEKEQNAKSVSITKIKRDPILLETVGFIPENKIKNFLKT